MKTKRVNRYYCDFCKKSGCSKFHMERHESGCTMNPKRFCKMCNMAEEVQTPLSELMAVLPDAKPYEEVDYIENFRMVSYPKFDEVLKPAIEKLRELAHGCPACILAAIRQSGIPKELSWESFDYKKEHEEFWKSYNDAHAEEPSYY